MAPSTLSRLVGKKPAIYSVFVEEEGEERSWHLADDSSSRQRSVRSVIALATRENSEIGDIVGQELLLEAADEAESEAGASRAVGTGRGGGRCRAEEEEEEVLLNSCWGKWQLWALLSLTSSLAGSSLPSRECLLRLSEACAL